MQFSLILTSLFCFATRMDMVQASNCNCLVVSKTRVHHSKIKEYTIQDDGTCLFRAIVFRTVSGKTICSDLKDDWANHVTQQLKKRRNPKISKDSSRSESPSGPSAAQGPEQTGTPALAPGSELPSASALVPSTSAMSPGSEQTGTPTSAPKTALGSETPSTPSAAPSGPASLSGSEPTSAPTNKTSASSAAPSSISAKSTPNPTSAPNTTSGASGTRSALHHILALFSTTRRAST